MEIIIKNTIGITETNFSIFKIGVKNIIKIQSSTYIQS